MFLEGWCMLGWWWVVIAVMLVSIGVGEVVGWHLVGVLFVGRLGGV